MLPLTLWERRKPWTFIDDLILDHIKEIGVGRVFVVCMDGDRGLDPLKEEKQTRSGTHVELLVHAHTNLKLEQCLHLYEVGLLPWDI